MKCKWKKCQLGDLITFQRGYDLPKTKMKYGIYPVVGSNGIIGYHNEYTTEAPSITIGRSGNVGKPFIYKGQSWSHNTTLYIKEFKNVDPIFVYYYLQLLNLANFAGGSAVPTLNRNHIHSLDICVPETINEQKKIAHILSILDDKIATNTAINKNLEEQAQAIFARYFINIENTPNGWTEGSLTDIAEYLNGLAMQKFRPSNENESLPVLKIKELRQGICDAESDRCSSEIKKAYIVHDGDVIFSWSGSLMVDFWCGGNCGLNQHLFKVTSEKYDKWFYYSWTNYHLQEFIKIAADRATTMGHIKRDALEKARVLIPSQEDYNCVGKLLQPLYDSIITKRIENRKLAAFRDTLLPRLMSGEIDVGNIEL